jgi:hypothetical protein
MLIVVFNVRGAEQMEKTIDLAEHASNLNRTCEARDKARFKMEKRKEG